MSIQTVLENWREYIDSVEFEALTNFLVRTQNGEKINKILVIEGCAGTGKTTFIKDITDFNFDLHYYDILERLSTNMNNYNGRPTPALANIIENKYQLIVIPDVPFGEDINDKLRILANNSDVVYRQLYGSPQVGKIKGNFIIMAYPNQLDPSLNDILTRIRFTHRF
jgi:hypothetical protein